MNGEQYAALLGIIVPQILRLFPAENEEEEIHAMERFYRSKVYALLEDEDCKLWHLSPLTIYNMYLEEEASGTFVIPEEAA